jgi:hypothetical protein
MLSKSELMLHVTLDLYSLDVIAMLQAVCYKFCIRVVLSVSALFFAIYTHAVSTEDM